MPSTKEAPLASGISAGRAALDAVLRSRTFFKNPRLTALLEYLCERCFQGQADALKEYNIATDVFARPPDFDQSQDAIVRVEMHRLRKKLAEFYAGEGAHEPIEIVIQSGRYLPEFVLRSAPELAPALPELPPEPPVSPHPPTVPPGRPQLLVWLIIAVGIGALAATTAFLWPRHAKSGAVPPALTSTPLPAVISPAAGGVRILCGANRSGIRDRQGKFWSADSFFTGGVATATAGHLVFRTRDSFLFETARTGEFSYKIPLKPGVYEMRLYFADQSYSPGSALDGGENTRVFNVIANGEVLLRDFDIMAEAGPNIADVRAFKDIRPERDGYLHLNVLKANGTPLLNAIEIVPGIPHRLRPIRIVTLDSDLTDSAGVMWSRDNYFLNGRTIARTGAVTGSDDPEIYARERYGNFSYAIPVSEGRYRVTLHFAETYWGPTAPGGGGVGTRVFDVFCNGRALLQNFDMLKEAPPRTQIVKTFEHLEPNAQGKLLISFVPVKNYANISAIEVVDESSARD